MTTQIFPVAQTFGVKAPQGLVIEGFADTRHPQIPPATPYVFRQGLAGIIAFLRDPAGDAFLLTGPTGSGKTSLIGQVANRLNWPVQSVTCHGRLELSDLVGQFVLINGSTVFVHGPLAVAMREGHLLLLNEIDLMDPSELAGLNDVIEGQPLVIPQNGGEVIRPHPKFRVFATGNCAGAGDPSGLYQGVLRQNLAFLDRFRVLHVGYLEPEVELGVLTFVDPRISPVLEPLEGFLRRVPCSGSITGALFHEGFGLWLLLRDEDRLARDGAGLLAGATGDGPTEPADVESAAEGEAPLNPEEIDTMELDVFGTEALEPAIDSAPLMERQVSGARPLAAVATLAVMSDGKIAACPAESTVSSELFEEDCFF